MDTVQVHVLDSVDLIVVVLHCLCWKEWYLSNIISNKEPGSKSGRGHEGKEDKMSKWWIWEPRVNGEGLLVPGDEGLLREHSPEKGRHPASLSVRVQGRVQSLEQEQDMQGAGEASPLQVSRHRCWASASSSSCQVPVMGPVYLGAAGFCLYLETREKRSYNQWPHKDGPGWVSS